jgi:hypothetical protein
MIPEDVSDSASIRIILFIHGKDPVTKTKGTLLRVPFGFDLKSCYFFLLFFFAFFLVAMFLFSLSIFHGCAVLSKKPQLMNV